MNSDEEAVPVTESTKTIRHDNTYHAPTVECDNFNAPESSYGAIDDGTPLVPNGEVENGRLSWIKSKFSKLCSSSGDDSLAMRAQGLFIGSLLSALYHVVYCLAQASAVTRKHSPFAIIGLIAKMSAVGTIAGATLLVLTVGRRIPSLYPCVDKFVAPFMATLATHIDNSLYQQSLKASSEEEAQMILSDVTFLATFATLCAFGYALSAVLIILASKFKLANFGSYLPTSVIAGFFSSIGIMLWTLAFAVDNDGFKVGEFFRDVGKGNWSIVWRCLAHHLPSLFAGIVMKLISPIHPLLTPSCIIALVLITYFVMFVTGTSLQDARDLKWFWKKSELSYSGDANFDTWSPPAPLGFVHSLSSGHVNYEAAIDGLPSMVALAIIYTLRSSFHSVSLKKNLPVMLAMRKEKTSETANRKESISTSLHHHFASMYTAAPSNSNRRDTFMHASMKSGKKSERVPDSSWILGWYGVCHFFAGTVGGFSCLPAMGAGNTLYRLGAGGVTPQIGGIVILFFVYLSEFDIIRYIPKMAFSSLLVLSGIELLDVWFIKSWKKTLNKWEWMVVPFIMILAYVIGLLQSVGVGVALSTFIFVAALLKSGVVKFVGSGLIVRSSIDRLRGDDDWLSENGDLIQVLVLHNYIFFGNASNCLKYINTMFDDPDDFTLDIPPEPKYLIIDMSLVTGMDSSSVDAFKGIATLTKEKGCRFFMSGVSDSLLTAFALGGFKPADAGTTGIRWLRFLPNLDVALGMAEDRLLREVFHVEQTSERKAQRRKLEKIKNEDDDGFLLALHQIDLQHHITCTSELSGLKEYTTPIEIDANQIVRGDLKCGIFFIEYGLMRNEPNEKVESEQFLPVKRTDSLGHLDARSSEAVKRASLYKEQVHTDIDNFVAKAHPFRKERMGPGYVIGVTEALTSTPADEKLVAITDCRLHYLPFESFENIEIANPLLMMRFYKLLGFLASRMHDGAVSQLSTIRSIMGSE